MSTTAIMAIMATAATTAITTITGNCEKRVTGEYSAWF